MSLSVDIVGAGLSGSEAALQLANRGITVRLYEMRPQSKTAVHKTELCAELVCSNSLKSMKPESAAGMLKQELATLNSYLYKVALKHSVAAGGALAVDRDAFAGEITSLIEGHPLISLIRGEVVDLPRQGDALIIASGPLTSDALATELLSITGVDHLSFYDAAAPIVMADSLDYSKLFRQSRYESEGVGDYFNAPFSRSEYENFINALLAAKRVIAKDFETKELFQACQPIEEIARKGFDAPRFGTLKPVGLIDPQTGRRPWAALQLRSENKQATSYNLVGFQTNLNFSEQKRVFRLIPGLEKAEFARYGVMHRNTFIDAPRLLDKYSRLKTFSKSDERSLFFAGQVAGTEGYCEAIMSGLLTSLHVYASCKGKALQHMPADTAFGSLCAYAFGSNTEDYQPMHVNFGIMPPLDKKIKNKQDRYRAYAERGQNSLLQFTENLKDLGLL